VNRSGYHDDIDDQDLNLYRGRVARTMKGKRSQEFLRELADAMDAMPEKILIANELVDSVGDCCTIGVVCKSRGIEVAEVDPMDPDAVGKLVDISRTLAAEIEFENDDGSFHGEDPAKRWVRMRKWVADQID